MSNISSVIINNNSTNNKGRLSLLFESSRGLNLNRLYHNLFMSAKEDIIDTFILVFHIRDCRNGKGERYLGRKALQWLLLNYPSYFKKIIKLIPEFGRWDDLLYFLPGIINLDSKQYSDIKIIQHTILKTIHEQLEKDIINMKLGINVSLCAKWLPTEGDSLDKKYNLVNQLSQYMNISKKSYRTKYISPLRKHIYIVENLMCAKKWNEINFYKVPSSAMKKLKKSFQKNCSDNFNRWKKNSLHNRVIINKNNDKDFKKLLHSTNLLNIRKVLEN